MNPTLRPIPVRVYQASRQRAEAPGPRAVRTHEEERQRKLSEEIEAIDSLLDARRLAIAAREARDYDLALDYHGRWLALALTLRARTGALASKAATLRRADRPAEALAVLRESIALDMSRERNKSSYTSLIAALREVGER